MTKKETLEHWKQLAPGQPIMEHMRPLAYKSTGSTYGACGIRIDGNPAFIDAVLSRLQDMMQGENGVTRLGLARNTVDGKGLDKDFHNKEQGAEVCYIRLHERGNEAKHLHRLFNQRETRLTKTLNRTQSRQH